MTNRLRFSRLASPAQPVALVFGEGGELADIPALTLEGAGVLPELEVSGSMSVAIFLDSDSVLPELEVTGALTWDSRTERPIGMPVDARFQRAVPHGRPSTVRFQQSVQLGARKTISWQDAKELRRNYAVRFQDDRRIANRTDVRWQDATPVDLRAYSQRFQDTLARDGRVAVYYQDAIDRPGVVRRQSFQNALKADREWLVRYQEARSQVGRMNVLFNNALSFQSSRGWARFQDAIQPGIGSYVPPEPPGDPCYLPPLGGNVQLRFRARWSNDTRLRFYCERHGGPGPEPGETIVVPIRKTYMTLNTLELRRVDTDQALLAYGFTLAIDADSWTWTWSATLRADALALVQRAPGGDPIVVEAMLNGVAYRFVVERVARDTRFASARLAVSGRGLAAILASPFAPSLTHSSAVAMTAQQLMANVLTINGVGMGWDLDWQLADWPVPAGAWSIQGSYMDAVLDIATAAGGYVQPHATEQRLRILPRYPTAPWDWSTVTPDIELPVAPVALEATEWVDKPAYNRIWLGGTSTGVFGPLTRAGTAGDLVAPQVNHALITDIEAWRQRGRAELASGGRQAHLQLTLQVLPETGLILPGKFIRYLGAPGIGIVRSTSYDWSTKRQTIGVETHVA